MTRESMSLTEEQWLNLQRRSTHVPTLTNIPKKSADNKQKGMNRTEFEYSLLLEARKQAGEILWWGFEAIKLKLTGRTFYTPDFAVIAQRAERIITGYYMVPRTQFIETKGFLRDDANVKFKVAAELFPWAEFFMYRKRPACYGGGWELMKHLNGGVK
jgi:hypothetical protein